MEIDIQRSAQRGQAKHSWLYTRHSFSFASYYNPKRMNFGTLRVLNEDIIEPGTGFGTHKHDNMEIVTIVLKGTLEHKDSMGNKGIIKEGEVQRMSAGSGVSHSEYNASKTQQGHFLQLWIDTKEHDIEPSYEQKAFSADEMRNKLVLLVSGKKDSHSLYMHQDAAMLRGIFETGKSATYKLINSKQGVFVFVISGKIKIENQELNTGDTAEITQTNSIVFAALSSSDVLFIEVPME